MSRLAGGKRAQSKFSAIILIFVSSIPTQEITTLNLAVEQAYIYIYVRLVAMKGE